MKPDLERHVGQGVKNLLRGLRLRTPPAQLLEAVHKLVAQNILTVPRCTDLILFRQVLDSDRDIAHSLHHIRKCLLHVFEEREPADQHENGYGRAHHDGAHFEIPASPDGPSKSLNHADHRVQAVEQPEL